MKTMIKKTIASLMAMATVTTCASALVSAEEANAIDISYKTLEESIVANDGTTIPAGAIAVNVSISANTGMSGTALEFNVDSELVKDSNGMAVVDSGNVFGRAATSGAQNGNKVVISEAAGEMSNADGTLFTFYLEESSDVSIVDVKISAVTEEDINQAIDTYSTRALATYIVGDANGDRHIAVEDATIVLSAIAKAGGTILPVSEANSNLSYYFPEANMPFAEVVDGNDDGYIMHPYDSQGNVLEKYSDPQQILAYYAQTAALLTYNVEGWYIGEEVRYRV